MMTTRLSTPPLMQSIARGMVAGVAGTVVMTAFQKLVEMPLTGRPPSYAPADLAQKVLPVDASSVRARDRLNWGTHFSLGLMWGTAYAITARTGLHGGRAVGVVFATVYTGDVLLNTALGLYEPRSWDRQDWTVDLVDKFVQAAATGVLYDHVLGSERRS